MFNTLAYAKMLEAAGVSRQQAEAHIQVLAEIVEGDLATKQDIRELREGTQSDIREFRMATQHDIQELRAATQHDIQELRAATQHDIQELRVATKHEVQELRDEMQKLEYRLVIKLGTIATAVAATSVAIIVALIKLT